MLKGLIYKVVLLRSAGNWQVVRVSRTLLLSAFSFASWSMGQFGSVTCHCRDVFITWPEAKAMELTNQQLEPSKL